MSAIIRLCKQSYKRDIYDGLLYKHILIKPTDLTIQSAFKDESLCYPKSYQIDNYFHNDKQIGYFKYRLHTGQLCDLWLSHVYRGQNIGKFMLHNAITNIHKYNTSDVAFAFAREGHPFWCNVYNKSFKWYDWGKLHWSITGPGYKMNISDAFMSNNNN